MDIRKQLAMYIFGIMALGCTPLEEGNMTVSVLEDVTEPDFIARPDAGALSKKFGLESNLWRGRTFRYGRLNGLLHNQRESLRLESGRALLGNELQRRGEVGEFGQGLKTMLAAPRDSMPRPRSCIWRPLMAELAHLQTQAQGPNILYIYSDLQENDPNWFSVHRIGDRTLLERSPEKAVALFLEHTGEILRNDPHSKVVVVHQPASMGDDRMFALMGRLYTDVFSELGIAIEFTGKL